MIYRPELAEVVLDTIAIIVSDLDTGEILWVNPASEAMFAIVVRGSTIGENVDDFIAEDYKERHRFYREELKERATIERSGLLRPLKVVRADGAEVECHVSYISSMLAGRACVVALLFYSEGQEIPLLRGRREHLSSEEQSHD